MRDLTQSHHRRVLHSRPCSTSCTIWTAFEEVQLAELEVGLSELDRVGSFPRRSGSPTSARSRPWPKLPVQPFRHIIPWGPITGQPAPHAQKATCAGQCLCNHVTASATATTTGESVDSAASSSTPTKNKELLPAKCPVAGGDPGGQRDLDLGSWKRFRGQWVRPVLEPGPVCLGRRPRSRTTQLMDDAPYSDAATPSESSRFLVAGIDILANPHLPVVPESPLKDRREAVLFMHYVHTLSLWACHAASPCPPPTGGR